MRNFLFSTLIVSLISNISFAAIRRVGYTGTALACVDYPNLATARNDSNAGGTIQVYGRVRGTDINKPLVIMGFGYNFDVNPGLQGIGNDAPSTITGAHSFQPGAEGSSLEGCFVSLGSLKQADTPTVKTTPANYITENTAIVGGDVTDEGSSSIQSRGVVYSEQPGATIEKGIRIPDDGIGVGSFSELIPLKPSTTYHLRAYALNNESVGYGNEISFTSKALDTTLPATFTDPRDGQIYPIKKIGVSGLVWMTRNLNYKRFVSPSNYTSNGVLYESGNRSIQFIKDSIAPPGWHVASQTEWRFLISDYGGIYGENPYGHAYFTGPAAKALLSTSEGGNNFSGFNASFDHSSTVGGKGYYSRSGFDPGNYFCYLFSIYINGPYIYEGYEDGSGPNRVKLYVRCVKNADLILPKDNPADSSNSGYKIIDPNPSAIKDDGTIDVNLVGLDTNRLVKGSATDGVSKLLLYLRSPSPVSFQIADAQDGTLQLLGNNSAGVSSITVSPDAQGRVIAVYNAPDGLGSIYNNQTSRQVNVVATYADGQRIFIHLKLVTPPVVLVHGMWSNSSKCWIKSGFKAALENKGFKNIFLADYENASSQTFNPDNPQSTQGIAEVRRAINEALKFYRVNSSMKVAISQVDIVAHSLGGLLTRAYSQGNNFLGIENFNQGTIHKLITLGTPHNGTPLGPLLWKNQGNLIPIPIPNLSERKFEYISLFDVLEHDKKPVGTCHQDFAINSAGLAALKKTHPYKTFSIQGNASIGHETGRDELNVLLSLAHSSVSEVMASRCVVPFFGEVANDLIVPVSSQKGYNDDEGKGQEFSGTAHLNLFSWLPLDLLGGKVEVGSSEIEDKVIALLVSNNKNDFGEGFPAPSTLTLDCQTTTERVIQQNNTAVKTPEVDHREGVIGSQYIKITSPIAGSTYQSGGGTTMTLSFDALGGAMPTSSMFMVGDLGWFIVPSSPPFSVNINIPANTDPGKINILALALDSSGITLADTASIYVQLNGTLQNLTVSPTDVSLDSATRTSSLLVTGTFVYMGNSTIVNLKQGESGTVYSTKKTGIISVDQNGQVIAVAPGADTVIVTNSNTTVKVPVTVANDFRNIQFYPNAIIFEPIPDKLINDGAFALIANASSGEKVKFSVTDGPATVENGVVTITGSGHVTIQATSGANSYFSAAAPVTQSFNVADALPILHCGGQIDTTTLEAEYAVLNGAVMASNQTGFTGSGFADYTHASGDYIEWTVNAAATGSYLLKFRYANGGTTNRPLELKVNGVTVVASQSFSPTSSFTIWSFSSTTTTLIAGINKIRLTSIGANGPNIDNLRVECSFGVLEAEDASLSGAVIASNQAGFTGSGFADYVHASGDYIEWTVNVNASDTGLYSLQFRYANGGTTDRPLKLEVNGAVVGASMTFSPTGSWAVWSISSATANLIAGANKVRLTTIGSNGPNVDHLTIQALTLEAEQAVLNGAVIASNQLGFTGSGFADYVHASGDYIEWTFNTLATGSYSLKFRYANGAATDRPLKLEVNGAEVTGSLSFSPTGGWTIWSISSAIANLIAGTNKVRLTTIGSNGPNVDHLTFDIVTCQSGTLEAEQAVLNGAVIASNKTGFPGSGFADYTNASGDYIEWTVNALAAGSFSLQFRYANGGVADRPLKLEINGAVVAASLSFSPTGSWIVWSVSSTTANLIVGTNKVRLTTIGSNGPNVDNLVFSCHNSSQSLQRLVLAKNLLPVLHGILKADVKVVPNPTKNILNIYLTEFQKNNRLTISIMSASGVVMKTMQSNCSNHVVQLNVSSLVNGVYTIKVMSEDKVLYKQFVKL